MGLPSKPDRRRIGPAARRPSPSTLARLYLMPSGLQRKTYAPRLAFCLSHRTPPQSPPEIPGASGARRCRPTDAPEVVPDESQVFVVLVLILVIVVVIVEVVIEVVVEVI